MIEAMIGAETGHALKDTLMTTKKRDSRSGHLIRGNLIGSGIARLIHFGDAGRRRKFGRAIKWKIFEGILP